MLKLIAVSDLQLGMYIHEFCGSGIEQSLWKSGFLLQNEHDLKRIVDSQVTKLWINVCRGKDVNVAVQPCATPRACPRVALDQEVPRAIKLCSRSKVAVETMFRDVRMGRLVETAHVTELVTDIAESIMRHPDALISLVRLKTSDEYTYMHSVAVCALMIALARQLNLPAERVQQAGIAGLMHDIGKVAIPVAILNKPGKLCDAEFATMRTHPEAGAQMLRSSAHFGPEVLDVCLHHHEKFDGSGYPHQLAGLQISLFARMGAICDVYDAVTSDRPYKRAWGPADSIRRMAEWQGHFDYELFQAFVKCVGIYPVGALVRLESGRIGVVTEQNEKSLLTPKVHVFYCATYEKHIPKIIVNLAMIGGRDRIVSRENAEDWGFKDTDQLWSGLSSDNNSRFD
ncbi:MAG TPA: HD-GYP domain-containing protein [Pseudomonas sp.]|jgi:putative nucleotidyltransferase with HDIG domain